MNNAPIGYANPKCPECKGGGVIEKVIMVRDMVHHCDGTDDDCYHRCGRPVPDMVQDLCDCLSGFPYEASPEDKGE